MGMMVEMMFRTGVDPKVGLIQELDHIMPCFGRNLVKANNKSDPLPHSPLV
jgi:hypothetical protein